MMNLQALAGDPDSESVVAVLEPTLPWLLHGLDQLEEHRRVSMSASVSEEEAPGFPGGGGAGAVQPQVSVHFAVCIEQWRIAEKITAYQKTPYNLAPLPSLRKLLKIGPGADSYIESDDFSMILQ